MISRPSRLSRRGFVAVTVVAAAGIFALANLGGTADPPRWLVKWRVGPERFKCYITRPADVTRVQEALYLHTTAGIPLGRVKLGTEENTDHAWHMENVRLVDVTAEIYDGRPSDVDANLDYWRHTVKRFGPWSARPLSIKRVE